MNVNLPRPTEGGCGLVHKVPATGGLVRAQGWKVENVYSTSQVELLPIMEALHWALHTLDDNTTFRRLCAIPDAVITDNQLGPVLPPDMALTRLSPPVGSPESTAVAGHCRLPSTILIGTDSQTAQNRINWINKQTKIHNPNIAQSVAHHVPILQNIARASAALRARGCEKIVILWLKRDRFEPHVLADAKARLAWKDTANTDSLPALRGSLLGETTAQVDAVQASASNKPAIMRTYGMGGGPRGNHFF